MMRSKIGPPFSPGRMKDVIAETRAVALHAVVHEGGHHRSMDETWRDRDVGGGHERLERFRLAVGQVLVA